MKPFISSSGKRTENAYLEFSLKKSAETERIQTKFEISIWNEFGKSIKEDEVEIDTQKSRRGWISVMKTTQISVHIKVKSWTKN